MTAATNNYGNLLKWRNYHRRESAVLLQNAKKSTLDSPVWPCIFPLMVNADWQSARLKHCTKPCLYPHLPELQRDIVAQKSALTAK